MAFELTIAEGASRGRRFRFAAPDVRIGRAPSSDLVLYDPGVSRSHARIREETAGHVLLDDGSANGTELNGELLRRAAALQRGDRIGVGPVVFVFRPGHRAPAWAGWAADWRVLLARFHALPRWARVCATAGAAAAFLLPLGLAALGSWWSAATHSAPAPERELQAVSTSVESAAVAPGDPRAAREWYDRGRRKLEERRVAPRNLYDAWKAFTAARRQLEGKKPGTALQSELALLIEAAEQDLRSDCKKLLFAARRFEKYGRDQKAQAAYREVLLHFPGEDPSGCRKEAQQELVPAGDGDGSAR